MTKTKHDIFVLNLDTTPERFTLLNEQAEKLGLSLNRISGVHGAHLTENEINDVYCKKQNKKYFRHELTTGEIGCYLGHRKIWQEIINRNLGRAIILEDDIILSDHFPDVIDAFYHLEKVELVKFHSNEGDLAYQTKPLDKNLSLINYKKIPNCAAGYGLTVEGARKLLTRKKIFRPVDYDFQFCKELNLGVHGLIPYSIKQNSDFESDIANINGGYHNLRSSAWQNIKFRARLWWHRKTYISGEIA